ncbi:unnamed protein product [Chilo suppressalis]|uniref:Uncharacterized protein n=1 Tax=Chilo suppressalis TaxID=168631 RepID=A0ABN8BED9_CHISP|nr:unnamed protein product [Chilo suppressalis]
MWQSSQDICLVDPSLYITFRCFFYLTSNGILRAGGGSGDASIAHIPSWFFKPGDTSTASSLRRWDAEPSRCEDVISQKEAAEREREDDPLAAPSRQRRTVLTNCLKSNRENEAST